MNERNLLLAILLSVTACGGSVVDSGDTLAGQPATPASCTPAPAPTPGTPATMGQGSASTNGPQQQAWSAVDLDSVSSAGGGVASTAFDGRFLYLVPGGSGLVRRYDTQAPLDAPQSWSSFDVATVDPNAGEFRGAAFDGRYVYFVPYGCPRCADSSTLGGVVTRYDSQAPFADASSWSTFDLTTVDPGATGYVGAAFDGRYLYLAPYGIDYAYQSLVARFDTQAPFASASSWSTFDTTVVDAGAQGFYGTTFDGRYVYFSPYAHGDGAYNPIVTRYDTRGSFGAADSWSTFDTSTVDARAVGYFGATFDGRYAYFVPYTSDGSYAGLLARFDTRGDFTSASSWSFFDTRALGVFPEGALFDGRYVYVVPSGGPSGPSGLVARLDTHADFASPASWTTFDTSTVNPDAVWFFGGGFDGRYIYLAPSVGSAMARLDARSTPALPAAYHGSFF
ncbi:MAG TPA: hypothetical protein VMI75_27520 [Polyangiaceae bacterium]|nr:hypothetical protein [Polyangiaceae bacterium]